MLKPLKEAPDLVGVILHEVTDINELKLDFLCQALEVSLFDFEIGHVENLIEDLVQFDGIKSRGGLGLHGAACAAFS